MIARGYLWHWSGTLLVVCAVVCAAAGDEESGINPNELRYENQQKAAREAREASDAAEELPLTLPTAESEPKVEDSSVGTDKPGSSDLSNGTTATARLEKDGDGSEAAGILGTETAPNSLTVRVATRDGSLLEDRAAPSFLPSGEELVSAPAVRRAEPAVTRSEPKKTAPAPDGKLLPSIRGGSQGLPVPAPIKAQASLDVPGTASTADAVRRQLQLKADNEARLEAARLRNDAVNRKAMDGAPVAGNDATQPSILAAPGFSEAQQPGIEPIDDARVNQLLASEPEPVPVQSDAPLQGSKVLSLVLGATAALLAAIPLAGLVLTRERSSRRRRKLTLIETVHLSPEHQLFIIESYRYALVLGITPHTTYQLQKVSMTTLGSSYRQTINRIIEKEATETPETWRYRPLYNGSLRPLLHTVGGDSSGAGGNVPISLKEMRALRQFSTARGPAAARTRKRPGAGDPLVDELRRRSEPGQRRAS